MKTIGLIGGMSFESTLEYYKLINCEYQKRLGGNSSAKIILYSMNFQEIKELQFLGEWEKLGEILSNAAINLERGGADFALICTNLMHKVAPSVEKSVSIPLLHIVDATAQKIKEQNIDKVGLLGTVFTMEHNFYRERLEKYDIDVVIPDDNERPEVSRIIYDELCRGLFLDDSREKYNEVINKMMKNGAEGVILGCTEIPLLLEDTVIPAFNTTKIHAMAAVEKSLSLSIL